MKREMPFIRQPLAASCQRFFCAKRYPIERKKPLKYSDGIYEEAIAVLIDDIHYSNASYSSKVACMEIISFPTSSQATISQSANTDG